jgi:hypothetical protein
MNRSRLNHLGIFILALLVLVPGLALAQGNGNGNANNRSVRPMPVLIITAGGDNAANGGSSGSGGALDGAFSSVIVYSNGLVLSTSNDDGSGTNTGTDCNVQAMSISQDRLNQLLRDLRRAGGLRAGSSANQDGSNQAGSLITVTVFRDAGNSTNSVANTFSFFEASGSSSRVLGVLNTFFDELGINQFGGGGDDNGGTGSGS